jgi:hypothetical protein
MEDKPDIKPTWITLARVPCFSRSTCKTRGARNKSISDRRTTVENVNNDKVAFIHVLDSFVALGAR